MKKIYILLALIVASAVNISCKSDLEKTRDAFVKMSVVNYAPNDEVTENFIRYSENGRANDVLLLQL